MTGSTRYSLEKDIKHTVSVHLERRTVQEINDRGVWERHIVEVTLDGGQVNPSRWKAFLRSYGPELERKRVLLYLVMQRLCAAMGIYKEPQSTQNEA